MEATTTPRPHCPECFASDYFRCDECGWAWCVKCERTIVCPTCGQ